MAFSTGVNNRNSSQCLCPPSLVWQFNPNNNSGACVCSDPLKNPSPDGSSCVCISSYSITLPSGSCLDCRTVQFSTNKTESGSTNTCQCQFPFSWDSSTNTCKCPTYLELVSSICRCKAPQIFNDAGQCVCDPSIALTISSNQCFSCKDVAYGTGSVSTVN